MPYFHYHLSSVHNCEDHLIPYLFLQPQFTYVIFVYLHSFIHHFKVFFWNQHNALFPSWLVSLVGRVLLWYCRGYGFKSHTGLNFTAT